MLAEAVALAITHRAELVLMHVVDGVGGTWYGAQTGDLESRDDAAYLESLAERLRAGIARAGRAGRRHRPGLRRRLDRNRQYHANKKAST